MISCLLLSFYCSNYLNCVGNNLHYCTVFILFLHIYLHLIYTFIPQITRRKNNFNEYYRPLYRQKKIYQLLPYVEQLLIILKNKYDSDSGCSSFNDKSDE